MFNEPKLDMSVSPDRSLVSQFNSSRDDFGNMERFPERLSFSKDGKLEVSGFGRLVKVDLGDRVFIVPHPDIRIYDVSFDAYLGKVYSCEGFTPNREENFFNFEIITPADLNNDLSIKQKGSLRVKK